jgi:hypothetical protein
MGASPAPFTAKPWTENAPAAQAMTTVPPRTAVLRPNIKRDSRRKPTLEDPTLSKRQHNDEASSRASKPLPRPSRACHHDMSVRLRWSGS